MINQEIIFNLTGQSFFYDPPEGRASGTPIVAVYQAMADDAATAIAATTGSASVGSVSTTFSASAGDASITVDSGTGITRGRRYLVTDTDGDREWVECISVTGTTVGIRQPLRNSYAASSNFVDCRISISVDSTWVAAVNNITDILDPYNRLWLTSQEPYVWIPGAAGYRLRWSYTVNSIATIGVSFADLVRYQAKNLVSPLDVDRRFPGWIDRLPTDYQEDQGQGLIDEAFQAIKMDCLGDEQVVRRIRNTEVLRELTIYRANLIAIEAGVYAGGTSADMVKMAQDCYEQRFKQLIREPKVPVDQTGGGSSALAQRAPVWRR